MSYKALTKTNNHVDWIDIVKPTKSDLKKIEDNFDLIREDVIDAFTPTLRSKIIKRTEYIFLVLMMPVYNAHTKSINVYEVDFFINENFLITVHQGQLPTITQIFESCKTNVAERDRLLHHSVEDLLFELLNELLDYIYPMIDNINLHLDQLKKSTFEGKNTRATVKEILLIRRNITDVRRAMRNHATILGHFVKREQRGGAMQLIQHPERFEELRDYSNEIWGVLESNKEMIEALEDANDALISHTLNDVMKTLTAVSVILLPAGALAGLFGMNVVHMPIVTHPYGFWILSSFILSVCLTMLVIFWKKHWIK